MKLMDFTDTFSQTQSGQSDGDGHSEDTLTDRRGPFKRSSEGGAVQSVAAINLLVSTDRVQINLSSLPPGCQELVVSLPNGAHLVHRIDTAVLSRCPDLTIANLSEFTARFLIHLEVNEDRKESTIDGYRKRLGQFAHWLAEEGKDPTLPETWLDYYATLKRRGLAAHTRKGHYDRLRRFGRWLVEKGYLVQNPMDEVRAPSLPKNKLPKAISRENIRAMLKVAREPRERALLLLFRDSGGRAMEILDMTWSDVDFEERKIAVEGKGDKARFIFFKRVTGKALADYRETVPHKAHDPVWWGKKGPLTYSGLYKIFKHLADEAGVGDEIFNPHAWRHAFGRDTTRAGIPTAQLQDLLGHSSREVTKIYTQFDDSDLQEAHDRYSPVEEDLVEEDES